LWLRELAEPLIPSEYYNACIAVGQKLDDRTFEEKGLQEAREILNSLPGIFLR
jgi:hypothetical protein